MWPQKLHILVQNKNFSDKYDRTGFKQYQQHAATKVQKQAPTISSYYMFTTHTLAYEAKNTSGLGRRGPEHERNEKQFAARERGRWKRMRKREIAMKLTQSIRCPPEHPRLGGFIELSFLCSREPSPSRESPSHVRRPSSSSDESWSPNTSSFPSIEMKWNDKIEKDKPKTWTPQ